MKINRLIRLLTTLAFTMLGLQLAYAEMGLGFVQLQSTQSLTEPAEVAKPTMADMPTTTAPSMTTGPQPYSLSSDYAANQSSDVFGAHLFMGAFARQGPAQFNPDYLVAIGDKLQIRLWGAFEVEGLFTVDPQGNIFLPHVGPVKVLGVRNTELQKLVEAAVSRVFRANVYSYASLAAAQPVRVFVGGFARRPGLYNGTSMDSLLHYLDQAGGIDPERGSFIAVQVKRGDLIRTTANLYDFLLEGRTPLIQLADGDVIFVQSRQSSVKVSGLAENAKRFEFAEKTIKVADVMRYAKPLAEATHVRVVRNSGLTRNVDYYPLEALAGVMLQNGDEIEFTADKKPGTITVRVEGEHQSPQEYVLPYGAKLGDLIKGIQYSERSDAKNIQLFRLSVKERQKSMMQTALRSLESSVLTARASTHEEAGLRKSEADLILQWVDRAKQIEPNGQVIIAQSEDRQGLLLENGDVIRIPTKDGLVLLSGEVLFPSALAFDKKLGVEDYIRKAGGYSQSADTSRVIVAHRDGSFEESKPSSGFWGKGDEVQIQSGDEILVLPKIQTKNLEIGRALTQIIYQIAVATKVILNL